MLISTSTYDLSIYDYALFAARFTCYKIADNHAVVIKSYKS